MSRLLGKGVSQSKELELDRIASAVKVKVIDTEKLGIELEKATRAAMERLKDADLELTKKTLALYIDATNKRYALLDDECVGEFKSPAFEFSVRRKSIKSKTEEGVESTQYFPFPAASFELELAEVLPFVKEEMSLKEFMGDRFNYNSRIVSNLQGLLDYIKTGK
jgi:hypothetical protein